MNNLFTKAKRYNTKLRIALMGATNVGKTFSALLLAYGMVKTANPTLTDEQLGEKIILIDTERGRAKMYADRKEIPSGFLHGELDPPYTPERYVDYIQKAAAIVGSNGVIIVDSLSHEWAYDGGTLETHTEMSKKAGKNSYTAWNEAGRPHNNLISKMMSVDCHVIATLRAKMGYVLETSETGKSVPKPVGVQPIQRNDTEFEFDITFMLDREHVATIIKDTTFLNAVKFEEVITPQLGIDLINWSCQGADAEELKQKRIDKYKQEIKDLLTAKPELISFFKEVFKKKLAEMNDITELQNAITVLNDIIKE